VARLYASHPGPPRSTLFPYTTLFRSTPAEFDIIFRGDIVIGHQLQDVKARLQQLFKTDAARIDALFTGRPVALKRGLDQATANKDRKSTRLNSSHVKISYAVFCLKKT